MSVNGDKATVTVSAKKVKATKFKGTVVAKKIVRTDEFGARSTRRSARPSCATARPPLTLKKLTKGKNKVVFVITLKGGKYGDAEVARTIKVKALIASIRTARAGPAERFAGPLRLRSPPGTIAASRGVGRV